MIQIFPDPETLATGAARTIAEQIRAAVAGRGRCAVALAGGSTPSATYRALAAGVGGDLPWPRVDLVFGDERMVAPDDDDSNYKMVARELLASLPAPPAAVHRVPTELGSAADAATAYERTLRELPGLDETSVPALDLVLLGLGKDGHTASLMPGCAALGERQRLVAACRSPRHAHERVTLTPPILNAARSVLFLVAGERKAAALRAVLEGPYEPERLPAQGVHPAAGEPWWLVDAAAASALEARSPQTPADPRRASDPETRKELS